MLTPPATGLFQRREHRLLRAGFQAEQGDARRPVGEGLVRCHDVRLARPVRAMARASRRQWPFGCGIDSDHAGVMQVQQVSQHLVEV